MKRSPLPLEPELVDQYRIAMTRVDPDDWDALKHRVDTAKKLAVRAYVEEDQAAWEVVQVLQWRLQTQSNLRPTETGDVAVLDAVYRIEESTLPKVDLPRGLTPKQFADKLSEDLATFRAVNSEGLRVMIEEATREDWEYFGYQMLVPTGDFCRMIAISSLPLPHELARFMYYNLNDEAGQGVLEEMHHTLLNRFLEALGVDWRDKEKMLSWAHPYMIAMINVQNRLLWHPNAAYSLGSMFIYEKLVPDDLTPLRKRLSDLGFSDYELEWFSQHIVVDVQHAEDWLGVVESHLQDYDQQKIAYQAAVERGQWSHRMFNTQEDSFRAWKETGVAPHLPFRELREQTGL